MRISDWSSDVCSSDLRAYRNPRPTASPTQSIHNAARNLRAYGSRRWSGHRSSRTGPSSRSAPPTRASASPPRDRHRRSEERRVGKEGVVRVDLGGRRIIKKKKETKREREQTEK